MKQKILMVVFVLILGSTLTTALVAVDKFTAPRIEKNERRKEQISVLNALGIEYTEDKVVEIFLEKITTKLLGDEKFYIYNQTNDIAFGIVGSGLWGPIKATIALKPGMVRIKGVTMLHQEETPGLGSRIGDADFLERFANIDISAGLLIQSPGKALAPNEIDGITGATLSCKAFEEILNKEIARFVEMIKESK